MNKTWCWLTILSYFFRERKGIISKCIGKQMGERVNPKCIFSVLEQWLAHLYSGAVVSSKTWQLVSQSAFLQAAYRTDKKEKDPYRQKEMFSIKSQSAKILPVRLQCTGIRKQTQPLISKHFWIIIRQTASDRQTVISHSGSALSEDGKTETVHFALNRFQLKVRWQALARQSQQAVLIFTFTFAQSRSNCMSV